MEEFEAIIDSGLTATATLADRVESEGVVPVSLSAVAVMPVDLEVAATRGESLEVVGFVDESPVPVSTPEYSNLSCSKFYNPLLKDYCIKISFTTNVPANCQVFYRLLPSGYFYFKGESGYPYSHAIKTGARCRDGSSYQMFIRMYVDGVYYYGSLFIVNVVGGEPEIEVA